jgi:hypothetical protein
MNSQGGCRLAGAALGPRMSTRHRTLLDQSLHLRTSPSPALRRERLRRGHICQELQSINGRSVPVRELGTAALPNL